jgi:Zn-finger nucleic acid-binding protein
MKCPVDNETLVMTERSGVEIDYCPTCRGVWLDRGELDKIIDRAAPSATAAAPAPPPGGWGQSAPPRQPQPGYQPSSYSHGSHDRYGKKKKREGFLGELFDF